MHRYQVLREVPSLPYESTATPTVHQMRVSSHQSHQPPLARVPVYVPNRPSNYRRAMNHVTQTQPPSSLVGSYVITPFSGFMLDNGLSGLQFLPHAFGGPSWKQNKWVLWLHSVWVYLKCARIVRDHIRTVWELFRFYDLFWFLDYKPCAGIVYSCFWIALQ